MSNCNALFCFVSLFSLFFNFELISFKLVLKFSVLKTDFFNEINSSFCWFIIDSFSKKEWRNESRHIFWLSSSFLLFISKVSFSLINELTFSFVSLLIISMSVRYCAWSSATSCSCCSCWSAIFVFNNSISFW